MQRRTKMRVIVKRGCGVILEDRRSTSSRGAVICARGSHARESQMKKKKDGKVEDEGNHSSVDNSSGSGRYGLEVRAAGRDEVLEHLGPVFALVPRDLGRWVDLDGHDLADATALDEDDEGANATGAAAALLAPLDVGAHERVVVGHV